MKKTLFTLLTAINLAFLYCPAVAVFALIKDETAAAVASVRDCLSESRHKVGRYPALSGHRCFTLARLDAVRGTAGFSWF